MRWLFWGQRFMENLIVARVRHLWYIPCLMFNVIMFTYSGSYWVNEKLYEVFYYAVTQIDALLCNDETCLLIDSVVNIRDADFGTLIFLYIVWRELQEQSQDGEGSGPSTGHDGGTDKAAGRAVGGHETLPPTVLRRGTRKHAGKIRKRWDKSFVNWINNFI